MSARAPSITVCVCTHNRVSSLEATLESLAASRLAPGTSWEMLLVDNNSSDATPTLAQRYAERLPLRYLLEPAVGLSHARNRALEECRSPTLLFTDDDVRVESSWLSEMLAAADASPDADYFGGRILAAWPSGRPRWLRDENLSLLAGLLVHYDLGYQVRAYRVEDPLPYGANLALRRRLFASVGGFRTDLGPAGSVPGRGDDSEYIARARAQGFSGSYVGTAVVHHHTDPDRLTLGYLYRYGIEKGRAEPVLRPQDSRRGSRGRQLSFLLRGLAQLARGRGDRFRQCVINVGIEAGLRQGDRRKRTASLPGRSRDHSADDANA